MNVTEMNEEAIRARLAALADEKVQAQSDLSALLDGGDGKAGDYVRLSFAVEKLQAEENRLTRELPFSQQRALDAAEVEADTKSYAAAAALKEAKREMQARLRESGFAKTHEKHLDEIVEHADAIIALRAEAGKASNAFHKASMAAARHRGELPRQV